MIQGFYYEFYRKSSERKHNQAKWNQKVSWTHLIQSEDWTASWHMVRRCRLDTRPYRQTTQNQNNHKTFLFSFWAAAAAICSIHYSCRASCKARACYIIGGWAPAATHKIKHARKHIQTAAAETIQSEQSSLLCLDYSSHHSFVFCEQTRSRPSDWQMLTNSAKSQTMVLLLEELQSNFWTHVVHTHRFSVWVVHWWDDPSNHDEASRFVQIFSGFFCKQVEGHRQTNKPS